MTGWILVATGAATAVAGLAACLFPRFVLRLGFAVEADAALCFFVRHWGLLIGIVSALLVAAASVPGMRGPVLIAAASEKFAIGGLVFYR
jgi:hypothetical protein